MSKICLLYPPQQSHPNVDCKPEGALAYPSLGAALIQADHDVFVFDACIGNDKDSLDCFYNSTDLPSGLKRTGVSEERILEEVADCDIVGITSIFTAQETMALECARLIKRNFSHITLISGGTNARSRASHFLEAGFDIVCLSEAEKTIVEISSGKDLSLISGIRCNTFTNPVCNSDLVLNLDDLPVPAWELHPNERYWKIGRPHGAAPAPSANNSNSSIFKYSSMMTSLGCVFKCKYCHISGEGTGSLSGNVSTFRIKSIDRVKVEFQKLKDLGVEELFLEDDTLFGHKRRGIQLLKEIKEFGFKLWDINGINIAHLLKFDRGLKKFLPDLEVLDVLCDCSFRAISLPIESGNQRIIDYYASSKWDITRSDIDGLIRELNDRGISSGCNYMIGYPDETEEEIQTTIEIARGHMAAGAKSANFMLVIPLPGTKLHDEAIDKGYLDPNFNPDTFNWRQASMQNTVVPKERLEEIHQEAYRELN